jgi:hypothetical protein
MREAPNVLPDGGVLTCSQAQFLFPETGAVEELMAQGLLKALPSGDFLISFVGVAVTRRSITAFFPKGLSIPSSSSDKLVFTRLILKALRKYSTDAYWTYPDAYRLTLDAEVPEVSEGALAQWLIEDYRLHGVYERKRNRLRRGGGGQIAWRQTIDSRPAYFSNGQPAYLDFLARETSSDNAHLVSRLHLSAVAFCIEKYGVLFGADIRMLDHENVEPMSMHPAKGIAARAIERELSRVYTDRAIRLLKILRAFYGRSLFSARRNFEVYGTATFEYVWETICGAVIGNNKDRWIHKIPLPKWKAQDGAAQDASALRPDIVREFVTGSDFRVFLADAKYYSLSMPPKLHGNPGVSDVSKQLLYEIFLRNEAQYRNVIFSGNAFIFPATQNPIIVNAGEVSMEGLNAGPVRVYYLNVSEGLQRYLSQSAMSDAEVASTFGLNRIS